MARKAILLYLSSKDKLPYSALSVSERLHTLLMSIRKRNFWWKVSDYPYNEGLSNSDD